MRLLAHFLRRFIQTGTLRVIDAAGKLHVFSGSPEPVATIRLRDKSLYHKLFFKPDLAAGEAYMDGNLTMEDCSLADFMDVVMRNHEFFADNSPFHGMMSRLSQAGRFLQQYNPAPIAQRNVAHHYDISNDLYRLFLDDDLQYSCAYFRHQGESLEQAQLNKKRHIAAKLMLKPGQRVLDIGCGWGGLSLYLAKCADVEITGITLSEAQLALAKERAGAMGLADRVTFRLQDYREVEGPFDRIVSVGMFEHVGVVHYDTFFQRLKTLLTDDGIALLHSIGHAAPPHTTNAWVRKYIFPGGYSPSLSEALAASERQYLWVTDVEILRLHYAETIKAWRARFASNRSKIARMHDERFCRMWEFYLTASEMLFRHDTAMVFQMQLARKRDATPLQRNYMQDAEEAMLVAESAGPRALHTAEDSVA
jgi:cyclopropane-fatty-acyl-phospholipid synthase